MVKDYSKSTDNNCKLHEISLRVCDITDIHQYHGSHWHRLSTTYGEPYRHLTALQNQIQ